MKNLSILLSITLMLFSPLVKSQSFQDSSFQDKANEAKELFRALSKTKNTLMPDSLKPVYLEDSIARVRYFESLTRYFEYKLFGFNHREKVFNWQLFSSKIIFYSVLLLLIIGMYFSYLQFRKAMKSETTVDLKTDLEASTQGFKVSSPVLGVIILLISLVFFYLYLVHIYPIKDVF